MQFYHSTAHCARARGNMPIVVSGNSVAIDCISRGIGPDDYPFFIPGRVWAEPDIDAAAAIMRQLAADPAQIATIGAAARHYIETVHSPAAVGHLVKARLAAVGQ